MDENEGEATAREKGDEGQPRAGCEKGGRIEIGFVIKKGEGEKKKGIKPWAKFQVKILLFALIDERLESPSRNQGKPISP